MVDKLASKTRFHGKTVWQLAGNTKRDARVGLSERDGRVRNSLNIPSSAGPLGSRMASSLRVATLLLLATAAACLLLANEVRAEEYWVLGMPDEGYTGPPNLSTIVAVTNPNLSPTALPVLATFSKSTPGGLVPQAATLVPGGSTFTFTFTDYMSKTMIGYAGVYAVESTGGPLQVIQLTTANGAALGGNNADGTHILEASQLGTEYTALTYPQVHCTPAYLCTPPSESFVTIIAKKQGTTVEITPSVRTAHSLGCAQLVNGACPAPDEVPTMNPPNTYSYVLDRGQAIQVMGDHAPSATCPACNQAFDVTGTRIKASSPVAVFAGAGCSNILDGSCDTLNDQMLPAASGGSVYPLCANYRNVTGASGGHRTGQIDMIRVHAISGSAQVTFSRPVSTTPPPMAAIAFANMAPAPGALPSPITTAIVTATPSTFYYTDDVVLTATKGVMVMQYMARADVWAAKNNQAPSLGYVQNYNPVVRFTWGDPAMAMAAPIENTQAGDHWIYTFPAWENHIIVAHATGTEVRDAVGTAAPMPVNPSRTRAISGTGYSCTHIMDLAEQGQTHHVYTSDKAVISLIGLGASAAYWIGSEAYPVIIPPCPSPPGAGPCAPVAGAKVTTRSTGCGPRPVQFTDMSTPGSSPIAAWMWNFGDGGTSTDQNPTHTYPTAGDYIVTLTVTDNNGFTSQTISIIAVTEGAMCIEPTIPQDNGVQPRAPHDGVDAEIAEADVDGDGIANAGDNCVFVANADQLDFDLDAAGDECDVDKDGDGVMDAADNCVDDPNSGQADLDADGDGNVCDEDLDGDTILNVEDNCRFDANLDQADGDANQIGDLCEEHLFVSPGGNGGASAGLAAKTGSLGAPAASGMAWATLLIAALVAVGLVVALLVVVMRRRA